MPEAIHNDGAGRVGQSADRQEQPVPKNFWETHYPAVMTLGIAAVGGWLMQAGRKGKGAVVGALVGIAIFGGAAQVGFASVRTGALNQEGFHPGKMKMADVIPYGLGKAIKNVWNRAWDAYGATHGPPTNLNTVRDCERRFGGRSEPVTVGTDGVLCSGRLEGIEGGRILAGEKGVGTIEKRGDQLVVAWHPEAQEGSIYAAKIVFQKEIDRSDLEFRLVRPPFGPLGAARELEVLKQMARNVANEKGEMSLEDLADLVDVGATMLDPFHPALPTLQAIREKVAQLRNTPGGYNSEEFDQVLRQLHDVSTPFEYQPSDAVLKVEQERITRALARIDERFKAPDADDKEKAAALLRTLIVSDDAPSHPVQRVGTLAIQLLEKGEDPASSLLDGVHALLLVRQQFVQAAASPAASEPAQNAAA